MRLKKVVASIIGVALLAMGASACTEQNDADVASQNLSTAADNFEVLRRVVFYNGITEQYMLEIEGYCSLGNNDSARELTVTCKTGGGETDTTDDDQYKKHFLGLSDNVTFFVEQIEGQNVSVDHYRVVWKPSVIIPDIEVR